MARSIATVSSSLYERMYPARRCYRGSGLLVLLALAPLATRPAMAAQLQVLAGHVPAAVSSARARGTVAAQTRLNLAIGLPLRNEAQLDALLLDLSDPDSPQYHQYLQPAEFAAAFGPSEADYAALIEFAEANHLTVTATHPNRTILDVTATVEDVERAFHVRMMNYTHPTRGSFYAPDREPSLVLDIPVLDVSGLDNYDLPHPMALRTREISDVSGRATPYITGSGPGGYFIGKDFRAAYAPQVTLTGAGQTIGLLEFDGFFPSDVPRNFAAAGLPAVPTQTVLLDGVSGAAGSANTEVILDIMMAAYMAPGAAKIMVYEGATPNDILNRMATDNQAQQISSSWGFSPVNATTEQIFKQYVAQGQSVLQASGDSGAYSGGVMSPSDDPNLTIVGGSSLSTAGAGGPWQAESAWSGSGGGVSTVYPIPAYQRGVSMAANGGSATMRNIPDVALTADIQMYLIQGNGQPVAVGGTSAAAPLWAGFIALANQQAAAGGKPRVGFLNPLLYAAGGGSSYVADFHDITRGSNNGYSAVTAYDLTTGWGTPAGQHLISDLAATTTLAPSFSLAVLPSSITVNRGSQGTASVTLAPQGSFNAGASLAITGLPAGTTAIFNPVQATAGKPSTVTYTVGAATPPGTYPVTVTGVAGSLSSRTTMSLTVVAPSFSLSSAASLSMLRSGSASTTVSVSAAGGFSGMVNLSAGALPSGVTASFRPSSTSTSSVVAVAASATAVPGTYVVIVSGTSGALKASESISLTVFAPSFSLAFVPATLTLPAGSYASGTLTLAAQNGFTGAVSLAAAGLPAGVTAAFAPLGASGTATVTFTATGTVAAGSYPVSITGTSGLLKASASLSLKLVAAPASTVFVNLAPSYNVNALVMDGAAFTGAGLDGGANGSSTAYSADLVGQAQLINGMMFYFGPANAMDAVSSKVIALPAAQASTLNLLATAVNGSQGAQLFRVTYTDGTIANYTQSLSDWFTPQAYAGESRALTMAYRDNGQGQKDNRTFYLYEYSLALNAAKKVSSITLPTNRNIVVLAASLNTATGSSISH